MRVMQCGVHNLIPSANLTQCVDTVIIGLKLDSMIIKTMWKLGSGGGIALHDDM